MWEVITLTLVVLCIALFRSRQNWKNRAELGEDTVYRLVDGCNQYRDMLVQYAGWLRANSMYSINKKGDVYKECLAKFEQITGIDSAV